MYEKMFELFQVTLRLSERAVVVILLIYLIRYFLKSRISARNVHRLWLLVPVTLLFFPTVPFIGSVYNIMPMPNLITVPQKELSRISPIKIDSSMPTGFQWKESVAFADSDQDPALAQNTAVSSAVDGPKSSFLLLFWLEGGSVVLLLFLWQFLSCRIWLLKRQTVKDSAIRDLYDECRRTVGIRYAPRLMISPWAKGPVLLGWFRPILLLPAGLVAPADKADSPDSTSAPDSRNLLHASCPGNSEKQNDLIKNSSITDPVISSDLLDNSENLKKSSTTDPVNSPDSMDNSENLKNSSTMESVNSPDSMDNNRRNILRSVFLHELAHWRRGDTLLSFLMSGLLILHWFNPLLWFALRSMNGDREEACDELASQSLTHLDRLKYAGALVEVAKGLNEYIRRPGLVGLLEPKSRLRLRVERLCRPPVCQPVWAILTLVFAVFLGVAFLTAVVPVPLQTRNNFWNLPLIQLNDLNSDQAKNIAEKSSADSSGMPATDLASGSNSSKDTEEIRLTEGQWRLLEKPRLPFGLRIPQNCKITEKDFLRLSQIKSLRFLDLSGNQSLCFTDLTTLPQMVHLKYLKIGGCPQLDDQWTFRLGKLYYLEGLDLSDSSKLTDNGLGYLVNLSRLRSLKLSNCTQLTDRVFGHLSALDNLQSLDLSHCPKISGTGLMFLNPQMEFLDLSATGLTPESKDRIKNFEKIRVLRIDP